MQFKHPEILWALLLLLIPILIHLLQLRRFKKTPFTNVAMLQRVVSESRKSQNLKKWLLLFTRLFLLAFLIIAFAQPFSSKLDALTKRETVIYLDNSFSMQVKKDGMALLGKSIQDLIQIIPETTNFTLFTNEQTFQNVTIKQIQNNLLSLETSAKQLRLDQIVLKAKSLFTQDDKSIKELLIISDLQERMATANDVLDIENLHIVQTLPVKRNNIYIDSLFLGQVDGNQISLNVQVVGLENNETVPISLYDDDRLIAKTAVKGEGSERTTSVLSLENGKSIKGRAVIEDQVLTYDNQFHFTINERSKPKILAISEEEASFLERVFPKSDFDFLKFDLNNLNYSLLESQNTIILNGLQTIPNSLETVLLDFSKNGGSLVIIPSAKAMDVTTYNPFLRQITPITLENSVVSAKKITKIAFQHPLYENVFEKRVTNFDYPEVKSFYRTLSNGSVALSFQDGSPFLITSQNCYVFTASLHAENSNFINSPLVVPTFFNIGEQSLKNAALYQTIGQKQSVDVNHRLEQDNILKLGKGEVEFIPLQQSFFNKVRLTFEENPSKDGTYVVLRNNDTLQNLSFNFPRSESKLNYLAATDFGTATVHSSISELFRTLQEDTSITDYWKWFVIFALLFAVLELLIQKLFP
ncbi:BatA domain-containing protein [Muricauda sp. SCSIO 64092]|uniref:BatA domain-containing protein n=1 Tax=Allomuricauda sp. SCSIO 64092 TaxID=2908842 RepID=UPI001FF60DA9|nr:BatA domain-containing protein [Muricauda sp. SCSIO 64092]UOY06309.1 BatA domain-containing protein [Muricauda sp. SCSIO 64092]